MKSNVSVVILSFNEEKNIGQALLSVKGWADKIFIVDSYSTDRTLEIAKEFGCEIIQHPFEDYAKQRNFALKHLPFPGEWVFFLDADEWLPGPLKAEITEVIPRNPEINGFFIKRRLLWMGRWIKHGYYPTWILRLFRHRYTRCEERSVNEHLIVEGRTGSLQEDFIHDDRKGLSDWIDKHNHYAVLEAQELLRQKKDGKKIDANLFGSQPERKRWLRQKIWNRLPPLMRPFLYYFYRYFLCGGFLDGKEGFIFHFLHGLWFPLLIDVHFIEIKWNQAVHKQTAPNEKAKTCAE